MTYTVVVNIDIRHLAIVALALTLFGIWYNNWVANLEHNGHDRGYMALIVALGCAVTAIGFGLVTSPWLTLVLFTCFAASGTPMIIGSILRYIHARDAEEHERRRHILAHLGEED